jgi:hypothetical protein
MWSLFHDAPERRKKTWSEGHTNMILMFDEDPHHLSREILPENARKMFWILWKGFREKKLKMEAERRRKRKRRSWNLKSQSFKEVLSKASFYKSSQPELNRQTEQRALFKGIPKDESIFE